MREITADYDQNKIVITSFVSQKLRNYRRCIVSQCMKKIRRSYLTNKKYMMYEAIIIAK